jgi:hypothetical protein
MLIGQHNRPSVGITITFAGAALLVCAVAVLVYGLITAPGSLASTHTGHVKQAEALASGALECRRMSSNGCCLCPVGKVLALGSKRRLTPLVQMARGLRRSQHTKKFWKSLKITTQKLDRGCLDRLEVRFSATCEREHDRCKFQPHAFDFVGMADVEGMILTSGGRFGGYGFYLLKGKPVWLWNMADLERIKWEGPDALTPGRHTIEFDFKYDGLGAGTLAYNNFSGVGRPGTGTLKVDGKVVATKEMPKTLPITLQWDESLDIGSDTLTGVNDADYKPPFPLTAKLNKLTIKVDRPQLSPADIKKLQGGMSAAADGPVSEDLTLVQRLEERFEKREDCRKQADAQKLGPIERIQFVRKCLE